MQPLLRSIAVAALVVASATGAGAHRSRPEKPTFFERFTAAFEGFFGDLPAREIFATYYGGSDGLCNRPTADGGRLDCAAMTCAHRTLPLGSHVYVCGPAACRRLLVNDRGPYANGADLDMSPAAAVAVCGALKSCRVRMWPIL